ncbi:MULTISPECIES: ferredoxin [unclassified Streptomyces]|uniref:ferredoxin n=1 Tax=unclassified Streptomyces TaxID=2593676 RepID=UPI00136829AA|nr:MULTISPECIES: ferredoxin [unclassified Streptomyces]MCW5254116.1 ferredoxin [Streptomyces sp. SHP 1-2]MYU26327.1 ferredoxin [Streptomyces sp. SID8352]
MKISVERARCEGYGFCEQAAPTLMRLDDEGELEILLEEVPPALTEAAEAAVRVCPVAALGMADA